MWGILFFLVLTTQVPSLELRYTERAPRIDGNIEPLWFEADSATNFTQVIPDEGDPATERTTVYLLSTKDALYIAFRCEASELRAFLQPWDEAKGDGIQIYLDTFGDKRTGYFFSVNARGVQSDAIVYDDGRTTDFTWDGVWYASSRIFEWGYAVEVKIPYRSIRYTEGLENWGINFSRYISNNAESAFWAPMLRNEGLRISRFGLLKGVNPGVKGKYVEFYPVGLYRRDQYEGEPTLDKPHLGTDLTWAPTPHTGIDITVNPDFGEVEADPFKVNLSKYKLYYEERRPFFIKGTDIFEIIPATGSDFAPTMRLFYSRQIGKKLPNGEEVPLVFGAKLLEKKTLWEAGALFARTEPKGDESSAFFAALRAKRQIFRNSTVGFYYGAKEENSTGHFERVLSLDIALRKRDTELKTIVAGLRKRGEKDRFLRAKLLHLGPHLFLQLGAVDVGDSFGLSGIGFMPYRGYRQWDLSVGPTFYPKRVFSDIYLGFSSGQVKELGEPKASWYFGPWTYVDFRNNWGFALSWLTGREYESSRYFGDHSGEFSFWTDWTKDVYLTWYSGYNYGYYDYSEWPPTFHLGYQGWLGTALTLRPSPSGMLVLGAQRYYQFKNDKSLDEATGILRPQARWTISRSLSLSLYLEGVEKKSRGNFYRWRLGGTLAWMIAPKSWFYLAFNDLEEREGDRYLVQERIGEIKLRYLFFF